MSNEIAKVAVLTRTETNPLTPTLALNRELYLNSACTTLYCKDNVGVVHTLTGGDGGGDVTVAINNHIADANAHIQYQLKSEKGEENGYVGLNTDRKIVFKSRTDVEPPNNNDTTSFIVNNNTASRTYTFPNKSGVIALMSDVPGDVSNYQLKSEKGEENGYVGLNTDRKIVFKSRTDLSNDTTSFIVNNNASSKTYTFPDKSGVIALKESVAFRLTLSNFIVNDVDSFENRQIVSFENTNFVRNTITEDNIINVQLNTFTAPVTGIYSFCFRSLITFNETTIYNVYIFKNGVDTSDILAENRNAYINNGLDTHQSTLLHSGYVLLNAGDFIKIGVNHSNLDANSDSIITLGSNTSFSGILHDMI